MRKLVTVLIACFLLTALLAPASGAPAGRQVSREYTMSHGVIAFNTAQAHWTLGAAYEVFRPNPGERFVALSITDDSGMPARGHVHMDADGDGKLDKIEDFCAETPQPIAVGEAKKIEVGVIFGSCPDDSPAIVTQGTVTATFTK